MKCRLLCIFFLLFNYRVKRRIHFYSEKLKRVLIIKMYITMYNIWIMFCYSVQLTIDIVGVARTDAKKEREREEKKIETFFLQLTHSVRCFCFSLSASHSVIFLCGFRFTYFAWRERQRKRTYSNRNQDYNSFFFNRLKLNCIQRLCAVHCLCAYDCNIF